MSYVELYRVKGIHTELYRVMNCDKESKRDVQIHTVKNGIILSWCLVDTQVPIPIPGWGVLIPILTNFPYRYQKNTRKFFLILSDTRCFTVPILRFE